MEQKKLAISRFSESWTLVRSEPILGDIML